jgi:hypothetical protein
MGSKAVLPQDDPSHTRAVFGRALAALVAAQSNWSGIDELPRDERQAIETWAAKAKVDLSNPSTKARSKLLDVANNALMSVALGSTHRKAEDTLGDFGLLSPRLYEVEIGQPLKSEFAEHGLTKNEIKQAVNYPDAHQHLSPPPDFQLGAEMLSLFARVRNRTEVVETNASPEWSFVIANRNGHKVLGLDGYRIERKKLATSGPLETPLDLFRAFCDVYGCDLSLDQKSLGKFLVYARVVGTGHIQAHHPPGHKIHLAVWAKTGAGTVELAFGYAIDLTKYKALFKT